jgi:4-diphosphocytidyl-2-C-methyl-D-erythritol kinase
MLEYHVYKIHRSDFKATEGKQMDKIKLKALAKINLGLDVVRKREDGYHEVRMIMQTIHLYDQIELTKTKEPGIAIQTNLDFLPTDENNLIYKAAKLLQDTCQMNGGIAVNLQKRIPIAAGLAGGSTDAAAVLYGMNELFHLGFKRRKLMELGVKIGADVPYCLMRGTALAEGIGEKLKSLPPMPKCAVLLAKPGIGVSTKYVYENLKLDEHTIHPDIDGQIGAIKQGRLKEAAGYMGNVLESVTISRYPVIHQLKCLMMENGAMNAMMSGSGPTVFGLFQDEETARAAYKEVAQSHLAKQIYLTSIYNNRRR